MKSVVQKTFAIEGAANGWYSEDMTYLLDDGRVLGCITRGCVPGDHGSVGGEIPPGTFQPPHPIQGATAG